MNHQHSLLFKAS